MIPVGQPDAANVTAELKPFVGVTVTVDVTEDPTITVAGAALSEKLGFDGAVPVVVKL